MNILFLQTLLRTVLFTIKLGGRQRFPIHPLFLHMHIINLTNKNNTFFSRDEPKLTHDIHTKSIIYLTVHSWCFTFSAFGQMFNDIYLSLWYYIEYFHNPKNPVLCLFISLCHSCQTLIFFIIYIVSFFQNVI